MRRAHERDRVLRRSVGPTAWAVLADLRVDASPDEAGVLVVAASARRVGANVGVGKDTAARALRRLIAAGVLSRRRQGTDDAGRFGHCIYELHMESSSSAPALCPGLADTVTRTRAQMPDSGPVSAVPATARRASSRRRARVPGNQLSLLGPATGGGDAAAEARS